MSESELSKNKANFYVEITLSSYEAALIRKLRTYDFGEFKVTKQAGEPRRVETIGSDLLKESEALALQMEDVKIKEELSKKDKLIKKGEIIQEEQQ